MSTLVLEKRKNGKRKSKLIVEENSPSSDAEIDNDLKVKNEEKEIEREMKGKVNLERFLSVFFFAKALKNRSNCSFRSKILSAIV